MANAHDFKEDFAAVGRAALACVDRLLAAWLPEGNASPASSSVAT
jgi:hypothetical protein